MSFSSDATYPGIPFSNFQSEGKLGTVYLTPERLEWSRTTAPISLYYDHKVYLLSFITSLAYLVLKNLEITDSPLVL